MSRLTTWLSRQNPDLAKSMSPLKDVDFLHISTNGYLKRMIPRVGDRQMCNEDRCIPRICGSETIVGCIYGHSAVYDTVVNRTEFTGTEWRDNKCPAFSIYRLNIEEVIRPSKKLVPDVVLTKELWVVPYAPEACDVKPEKIGVLLPIKADFSVELGKEYRCTTFYMQVKMPLKLHEELLDVGYYAFTLKGDLIPHKGKIEKPENFRSIQAAEWRNAVSKMSK